MARKPQQTIQDNIETNEEFAEYLQTHSHQLICIEVYSEFCGHCLATAYAVRKGKLEIGQDAVAMAKAKSDHIDVLSRFKDKSEPVFLFVMKGKLTRAVFGPNGIDILRVLTEELGLMGAVEVGERGEGEGVEGSEGAEGRERAERGQEIDEMLPEESAKIEAERKVEEEYRQASERLRVLTLAARKRRVCDRLARNVSRFNYILFWPHCHKAHYDLYEKWDMINVQVGAKETVQLKEEDIKEVLYMSDVEPNEACLHALLDGECLVVLFKMFETDTRNFCQLLRYTLYEEIPVPKEDASQEQIALIPPYERYATISKTAREVRRFRYNAKLQKQREEKEERERLAAEQARLARQAEEDRIFEEKKRQEEARMARIQAGLPADPQPEEVEAVEGEGEQVEDGHEEVGPEEVGHEEVKHEEVEQKEGEESGEVEETTTEEQIDATRDDEEFHSDVEVEDEDYIPPGGLVVPGLYTPPNDLARANGLAFFFANIVSKMAPIESEYLPPHVLVVFHVDKRAEVNEIVKQFADEILALGIFVGEDLATAEHIAYSVKQYNKMGRLRRHKDRIALMVSRKRSLPLLQLAGLNPCYISADISSGEKDCLQLFPVGYGDDFADEESVVEEEILEQEPELQPEPETEKVVEDEEEEEDG